MGNFYLKGEGNPKAKLTWKKVQEIRALYDTKQKTQPELSQIYNVRQAAISKIILNKTWIDPNRVTPVKQNRGENHPFSKLTREEVVSIRELYATGELSC